MHPAERRRNLLVRVERRLKLGGNALPDGEEEGQSIDEDLIGPKTTGIDMVGERRHQHTSEVMASSAN